MILSKAVQAPRASMEEQSLGWEEVQAWFKRVFTAGEAIEGSQGNAEHLSPVAAAHRILTNSFGLIPFGAYRKDGDARVPYNDERLRTMLKVRPNDCMSPFMLRKVLMSNAFWHGFGAVWNRRDSSGRVVQRLPLPTECCSILKDREGGQYWYQYNVDGMVKKFSNYELSFLFFETYDGIHGRGFLHLAREAIAVDAMAQRYGKKFYQNGARLSGIVEIDSDADRKTRDKVKAEFQSYATDDAFAVAVLDRDMKYTPLGLNQRDSQFIESREFSVEEVARFSGVPKHMLQTGKESYNSNAQQRLNYVTDVLLPYVVQCENEDSWKLPTPDQKRDGVYIHGTVEALLRADPNTRADFYVKLIEHSVMNPDECRAREELNPVPGGLGKQFLVTKNLGSLESVLRGEDTNA
ncbi:phage portal protein [Pseudoflavonifractor sp. DSM 107456]|uniref:Phage portal protein n=1 Tax=Pseudoflavonifractor gallinarum TaxID=2779352 RepID=A0ABR9RC61_9FIRM|nr:phage portal protein [Pseudoflavonifractor gallinarum]MBE5056234.1 phage portal protein [Pseudoflavonifractor gallinarum]